jgi:hypothetical protein
MTFLNSALLWGLLGAALPLLIHLFSRRKFPRIDFSTLRFLRRLQSQQMRRLRLRQWLLLLLRTLAIFLIAFAFLRPALRSRTGIAALSGSRISLVIILDASASMQAASQSGSCFDVARSAADSLLAMLNSGDRALVIIARKQPEVLLRSFSEDGTALRRWLKSEQPSDGPADLGAALQRAAAELHSSASASNFRTEIYLISDFAGISDLPDPILHAVPFFVQVDPQSRENLSASNVRITADLLEPGQPLDIEVILTNHGEKSLDNVYCSAFINAVRLAEDVVSLSSSTQITERFRVAPEGHGLQIGMIKIEHQDVLAADNQAYFGFWIPPRIDVLMVADLTEYLPLRLALSPRSDSEALLNVTSADRNAWDAQQLSLFDVIIFADPPALDRTKSLRLQNFVREGGGLMIFPGNHTDVAAINRDLLMPLQTPLWGEKVGKVAPGGAFRSWQSPQTDQPLLRGILRPEAQPVSPQFFLAMRMLGNSSEVLLRLSDGSPLLNQMAFGRGRVILSASSPHPDWSDWATRGIFAPLMHRLVWRLARSGQERCHSLLAGEDLEVGVSTGAAAGAILISPGGEETKLPPVVQQQRVLYRYPHVDAAGNYHLRAGDLDYLISANVPPAESDLSAPNLLQTFPPWKDAGAILTEPDDLITQVQASRHGRELWRSALIASCFCLLVESLLGSSRRSEENSASDEEA